MGKFAILIVLFVSLSFSCTKTGVSITRNDLRGSWKLVHITGGLAGIDSVPKENISINFETNGNYNITLEYAITGSGTYTLTKAGEPNYYYSETLLSLTSENNNKITYGISLQNDSLFLSEGCCDQFGYTYTRQK